MRNILKSYSLIFSLTLIIGCTAEDLNIPGKVTLISPADNQTCETGTSTSDTKTEMSFSWSTSNYTEKYDLKITECIFLTIIYCFSFFCLFLQKLKDPPILKLYWPKKKD